MYLFQADAGAIEARQHNAPAFGAQVYRRYVARSHAALPLASTASIASTVANSPHSLHTLHFRRVSVVLQRGKAAGTPPSTLRILPVLLLARVGEAKKATASAMSSGRM